MLLLSRPEYISRPQLLGQVYLNWIRSVCVLFRPLYGLGFIYLRVVLIEWVS